jgi:hypothetical protein
VGLTVFQALDRAIEAGGAALAGKVIVGTGKGATGLLDEMCSSGLLEKTAARTPKFTVTPGGWEAWEREAAEDRRRQIEQREQERQRQALAEFLTLVQKKQGKALTKTELPRFPAPVRQEACDRRLVVGGAKENTYLLLAAGEEVLLADQPVGGQLERLRQLHREMADRWRAVHRRVRQELDGSGGRALQTAVEQLAGRGTEAIRAFDSALAGLGGLAGLADAVHQVRAEVEAASRQAHQAVVAENERLVGVEARLRQEAGRQQEELETFERRTEARLADITRRLESAPGPSMTTPTPERNGPSPDAVWEAVRAAHEKLRQENLRIGGIVKVPELTDTVLHSVGNLTPAAFHEMLKGWQQEGRLTLQLCNDPRLEPRASEGVQSLRGLLFYVHMR